MEEKRQLDEVLERLGILEAKEDIREVMAQYNYSVDNVDLESLMELFLEDAAVVTEQWGACKGKKEIKAFYERILSPTSGLYNMRHYAANPVIKIKGDEATETSYFHETAEVGGKAIVVAGSYEDRFKRDAKGQWRYQEKKIYLNFMVPIEGEAWARQKKVMDM